MKPFLTVIILTLFVCGCAAMRADSERLQAFHGAVPVGAPVAVPALGAAF